MLNLRVNCPKPLAGILRIAISSVLALATFAGLPACTNSTSDKNLVIVNVAEGQRLTAGERGLLGKSKPAAWVDARTKADFDAGHIPGAMSLPFENVTADYYTVKDLSIIVVYGADYNDARAKAMSKRLMELMPGHDVRLLDGGVRAWTAAGNELEKSAS